MFRFIVLFALVAGSIYAVPLHKKGLFKKGVNLIYDYNFQHVFADPGFANLYGILSVESKAVIYPLTNDNVVIKLSNITIGPTQPRLNYPNPLMRMVTKEIAPGIFNIKIKEITDKLEIPIEVRLVDGIVSEIVYDTREVPESLNIKKGLISLLQLQSPIHSPKAKPLPASLEKSVQGICLTKWQIPEMLKPCAGHVEIVKSIDLDSCIYAPIATRGLISTYQGQDCEPKLKMIQSSTTARYVLTEKPEFHEITRVIGESIYQVMLNAPTEGRIALSLNQTLTFVRISKGGAVPVMKEKRGTSIIAELPVHKEAPFPETDVVEMIVAMIEGDIQAKDINKIILLAEYLNVENLRTIWAKTKDTRGYLVAEIFAKVDSPAMRELLIELLPVLLEKHFSVITDIVLFQSPDKDLLWELFKPIITIPGISIAKRQQLILSVGTYTNKVLIQKRKIQEEIRISHKLINETSQHMCLAKKNDLQKFWHSELAAKTARIAEAEKSLQMASKNFRNIFETNALYIVKAMGNMGWDGLAHFLLGIATDQSKSYSLRAAAVDSLRKIPLETRILKPLIHLYSNEKESGELRTRVFLLLTKFELTETTLMSLILSHQTEAADWVSPWVYKYLSSISKCHFRPMQKMSAKAEKAVTSLEPILPLFMKEKMTLPSVYENAHKLWQKLASLLVWHFSWSNDASLSSSAVDLQVIPGVVVDQTSLIIRIRSHSLAAYDDVAVEVTIPHTVQKLFEIIKTRNWAALADSMISLKRNEYELRIFTVPELLRSILRGIQVRQVLSLIWNANSVRIPTASGGFLFVDQKSTVVGWLPLANEHLTITSECKANAYINGHFMHAGAGMKTAVKLHVPAKLQVRVESQEVALKIVWKPVKKTTPLITVEQIPYTVLRQLLPKYLKGTPVIIQEVPLILSLKATDVNYIDVTENLALYAQLPMNARYPQDLLTTVWYGMHLINLAYKDEQIAAKTHIIEIGARKINWKYPSYIVETAFRWNHYSSKQNISISLVRENQNVVINLSIDACLKHLFGAVISIPWLKPLPAKCVFSETYQNITNELLRKADISQPCLVRSQIEQITTKYIRTWKKLTSFGLLDVGQGEHNIIAELAPESISTSIKLPYINVLGRLLKNLKKVQDFNQAAFQPLKWKNPEAEVNEVCNALADVKSHLKPLVPLDPSADYTYASWYHAAVYEILTVHQMSTYIFKEAVFRINSTHNLECLKNADIVANYVKFVKDFNKNFDPVLEKKISSVDDRRLFEKILEVEALMMSHSAESWLVKAKTNELLTLIPWSFNPENEVTVTLFLRAYHLVAHSLVFMPPINGVTLYEFWHLKQDVIVFFSLKKEFMEVLPARNSLVWRMNNLISKEFELFHNAFSYKRVALKAFYSNDTIWVNELMLEFDNLVAKIELIVAELKEISSEIRLNKHPRVEIVKTLYRMTAASEWSLKLLEENKLVWRHINNFGASDKAKTLEKLQTKIIFLWNNLKITQSCKSGLNPYPTPVKPYTIMGECVAPESVSMSVKLYFKSALWFKAQVTAKKSIEQLIHEHDQSVPGFRTETSYRYLQKLLLLAGEVPENWAILSAFDLTLENFGLEVSNMLEEWNILAHINSFNDMQIDSILMPSPWLRKLLASPAWKRAIRLLRWPLLQYWQIEDWSSELKQLPSPFMRLPTIRIIKYMDAFMADILVVRPTVAESFLEVPIPILPVMRLPEWIPPKPTPLPPTPVPPTPTPVVPTVTPTVPTEKPTLPPTTPAVPTEKPTLPPTTPAVPTNKPCPKKPVIKRVIKKVEKVTA